MSTDETLIDTILTIHCVEIATTLRVLRFRYLGACRVPQSTRRRMWCIFWRMGCFREGQRATTDTCRTLVSVHIHHSFPVSPRLMSLTRNCLSSVSTGRCSYSKFRPQACSSTCTLVPGPTSIPARIYLIPHRVHTLYGNNFLLRVLR